MEHIQQIRQGDVLLIRREAPTRATSEAPARATRVEGVAGLRVVGERTGHAHVLPAQVYDTDRGVRLVYLSEPGVLTHEEHAPVEVPAGWWEVRTQREYDPQARAWAVPRARYD